MALALATAAGPGQGDERAMSKNLILPGEVFEVAGRTAFLFTPAADAAVPAESKPWILYAPTLAAYPDAATIVVIAADLPYVETSDIEALLAAATPLAIAPSPDGRTNAIAARPPSAFTPSYGEGSAARHGGTPVVRPGLARDLDTPADLQEFEAACK